MIDVLCRTSILTGPFVNFSGVQLGRRRDLAAVLTELIAVTPAVAPDMPSPVIRGFVALFLLVSV